jgi:thiamine-phosphate pyrophosphorylase
MMSFSNKMERAAAFARIDLYPVISSEFTAGRDPREVLWQIADGGARIVQLREKNYSKKQICALAEDYLKITSQYGMLLIINDHLDIAVAVGADGVHLGQDDLPVALAGKVTGDLIIGCSTHNLDEAVAAVRDGADYINIGPIYPTNTKAVACGAVGLGMLRQISAKVSIPFTVMGGIKSHHIPGLVAAGALRIAMVTEITQADDITAKVKSVRKAICS